ncbi:hypothetical protein LGR54_04370 [Ancylobacter sp. Lp-2]|uniref:hypothetical protein n=1 Tax=Ancylobacter sp. Lp-2 TaxID=2881339 RepID=UPI001E39CF7F|nr:hypothetical protein [Ancylobacter sp. Lp-2]MCB4767829.1 hypothetical protein [Ancylobacter sp. Lp-2]
MKIDPEIRLKKLKDCQQGEIVRLRNGANIALVIENDPVQSTIAVLSPSMALRHVQLSINCISFGSSWVLEPTIDENTRPQNTKYTETAGSIQITDEGPILVLQNPNGWAPAGVNLDDYKIISTIGQNTAPILQWRLWLSEASRDRGEPPFFEFAHQPAD